MSNSFFSILHSLTTNNICNFIFRSEYYPVYYIFHVIYTCLNIRLTTNNSGLSWYRSIILNYCLSICPRYLLQVFLTKELPEFVEMTSFKGFFFVWALFNICPFDIIFILFNRRPILWIVQILDSFTVGRCLVITCETAASAFEGQFLRVFIISTCCSCSPILVDLFDRFFIRPRYDPMAYEIHYSKRLITAVLITLFNIVVENMDIADILIPLLFTALPIFDIYMHHGEVFKTCDIIFPHFWGNVLIFNPNPNSL
ncbi:hypothetical protein M9Y10_043829 [Tritrichomonas musculus]|uniref:Derlin n=1 Tax=Tritrichomonas musculus TaxID=1915356 RepID=A0ABR2K0S7_9EUKA